MRKVLSVLLLFAGMVATSCEEEKDLTSGLEPMVVKLALSQTGEQYVDLVDDTPSYSFNVEKNYPIYATTANLIVMTADELGENFTPLAEDQYEIASPQVDIADSERERELSVSFKNVTSLDPDLTYALGPKLESGSKKVEVNKARSSIIVAIKLGPEGTLGNPFVLSTKEDLLAMKEKCNVYSAENRNPATAYFRMANDIDMSGVDWSPLDDNGTRPIHFDGGNHTIKNFSCIKRAGGPSFFGCLWGTVENLKFENATIEAVNEKAGVVAAAVGLVGWGHTTAHAGVLRNVHVLSGTVTHTAQQDWIGWTGQAGGLCGELVYPGSLITECSANVDVSSNYAAGGLVGQVNNAMGVEKSFATGKVSCAATLATTAPGNILNGFLDPSHHNFNGKWGYAGGLIGLVYKTPVSNCYSTGEVVNTDPDRGMAGGLVGAVHQYADEVINCYTTSVVTARVNGGGIAGGSTFFDSWNNYIMSCIAWNPSVTTLGDDPNSGRVCGFMQTNSAWGANCYARADMVVTLNGQVVQKTEQADLITSGGPRIYEGRNASNLVTTARDVLKWSPAIWDFSGERPVLRWEKERNEAQ